MSVDVLERAGAQPAALAGLDIEEVDGIASLPAVAVVELASLDRVKAWFAAWPVASLPRRILDTEIRADH